MHPTRSLPLELSVNAFWGRLSRRDIMPLDAGVLNPAQDSHTGEFSVPLSETIVTAPY